MENGAFSQWKPKFDALDEANRIIREESKRIQEERNITPRVGDLATYYIGSDSYGVVIIEVFNFKSGPKAGTAKMVIARDLDGEQVTTYHRTKNILAAKFGEHYSGKLVIGEAIDYRDPSF